MNDRLAVAILLRNPACGTFSRYYR